MWISSIPVPCVEKTVLFLLDGLGTLVRKSVGHINYIFFNNPEENKLAMDIKIYLGALYSISLISMSDLLPVPHCFDCCSFVVSFEIKKCKFFNVILFFSRLF